MGGRLPLEGYPCWIWRASGFGQLGYSSGEITRLREAGALG